MKPGDTFYQVILVDQWPNVGDSQLVMVTHTITKIMTSGRVYFTSKPRVEFAQQLGKLDNLHNRYLSSDSYYLKHDTPSKAAEHYHAARKADCESARRKLESAIRLQELASVMMLTHGDDKQ